MDELRKDNAYAKIKGTNPPSEKVCRDLLKVLPYKVLEELRIGVFLNHLPNSG